MLGLGFIGSVLVLILIIWLIKNMDKDTWFLFSDLFQRTTENAVLGGHKAMDELENMITDNEKISDYKKNLVARRKAERGK